MRAGRQKNRVSIPDWTETNIFSKAPRPALENTQTYIRCVQVPLSTATKLAGANLTNHLYLSARTPIMSTATTPLFHMLHGLHRETFTFTILFSETKICPIAFLQLRHSDIYLQLTVQKHRMCVSRCDNKENDVEFPVIMPLHPYMLQLRPQQLKFEVKGNFARYGRRPAKDTLCSPLSGDFTLPTFPSSLHQINLS